MTKAVPPYTLPSPLQTADGKTIATANEWMNFQRPAILNLFKRKCTAKCRTDQMAFEILTERNDALDIPPSAVKVASIAMRNGRSHSFDMPCTGQNAPEPAPAFPGFASRAITPPRTKPTSA